MPMPQPVPRMSARVVAPSNCSPEIDLVVQTGDVAGLTDPVPLAVCARQVAQTLTDAQNFLTDSIYRNVSSAYQVTPSSQWIMPLSAETAQPLVVGDKGKSLASISMVGGSRSAGYGVDVLNQFASDINLAHMPAFKRTLSWLIHGNADAAPSAVPLSIGMIGINANRASAGLLKAGVSTTAVTCDFVATPDCVQRVQLLVIGSSVTVTPQLETRLRAVLDAGKPVLYLHTNGWDVGNAGRRILSVLGFAGDGFAGNYYDQDAVATGRSVAANRIALNQFQTMLPLLDRMIANTWRSDYVWSGCTSTFSGLDCSNVPGIRDDLLDPADRLRFQADALTSSGLSLYAMPNTLFLRLMAAWADVVRKQIAYPLDKTRQPQAFQRALVADSLVPYVRPVGVAQADLGSFLSIQAAQRPVSSSDEIVEVQLASESGFTAVGRFAQPGKPLTVELLDVGTANVALRLNTQRTGSTRTWSSYDRPRFLASPAMPLAANSPMQVTSPYGGTLQMSYSGAQAGAVVRLRVRGTAQHPFLDLTRNGDTRAFVAAIGSGNFDWAEIKLAGVEIHTRIDKMSGVLNGGNYGGDLDRYLSELRTLFFEDAYRLAGFRLAGSPLSNSVLAICSEKQWDCTNETWHKGPGVQHINADKYSHCGGGCSGNPYDQDSGVNPRGWTESHELGHNLQQGMLNVYDGRSGEVSNQLFPLHKDWRVLRELGQSNSDKQVNYKSALEMIRAANGESDKVEGAYQRIWSSNAYQAQNGERQAFYMQWVLYWEDRTREPLQGWDLITLLYLHKRQFEKSDWATYKNRLGYSTYATRPSPSGNDNMLITLSWLTKRDQRAVFDLWGVRYSAAAAAQVDSFGFVKETPWFYATRGTNDHGTVQRLDMGGTPPAWPF